jgi:hypothetical protein
MTASHEAENKKPEVKLHADYTNESIHRLSLTAIANTILDEHAQEPGRPVRDLLDLGEGDTLEETAAAPGVALAVIRQKAKKSDVGRTVYELRSFSTTDDGGRHGTVWAWDPQEERVKENSFWIEGGPVGVRYETQNGERVMVHFGGGHHYGPDADAYFLNSEGKASARDGIKSVLLHAFPDVEHEGLELRPEKKKQEAPTEERRGRFARVLGRSGVRGARK